MGDTILYLAGGAMSAVFGAGVLAKLQESHVYEDIEAVYAVSAGATNGAFFLSRQAHLLESLYCEDLPACGSINASNLWTLWQSSRKDVFDVDRAINVIMVTRALNTTMLCNQPTPLYAKVYNIGSNAIEYLDARCHGVFPVLHATASLAPFYTKNVEINAQHYVDGAVRESIGLQYLLRMHPDKRIVIVMNSPGNSLRTLMNKMLLRSILRSLPGRYYNLYCAREEEELADLRTAIQEERILLIQPPPDYAVQYMTNEKKALRQGFQLGYREAERILHFMQKELLFTAEQAITAQ